MVFLIVLSVIGLVGIAASALVVATGGYSGVRTRDAAFYRSTFDHAGFHARSGLADRVPFSTHATQSAHTEETAA